MSASLSSETIKQLIREGKTEAALLEFQNLLAGQQPVLSDLLSLLQARWSGLRQRMVAGVLNEAEAGREENAINSSLLELLERSSDAGSWDADEWRRLEDRIAGRTVDTPDSNRIQDSQIHIQDSREVIIGTGNTISRKIFHALGRTQFLLLLAGLLLLGGGAYFLGDKLLAGQKASYASLSSIQAELDRLFREDDYYRGWDQQSRAELEANVREGMQALQRDNFETAVQQLEAVIRRAPLAPVYQNLAYAYEQMGDWENATRNRREALRLDPGIYAEKPWKELRGKRINLLQPENGGRMLAGESPLMTQLADGLTDLASSQYESWAVFGFKDGRSALIDQVDFFVGFSTNPVKFEILVGNDSPTGAFTLVSVFEPFDGLLTATPFQPFPIPPVRAKYVKFQLREGLHWFELRVWGTLE